MKNIFLTIAIFAAALATTSCSDWLDVNDNPNYLASADAQQLMPTVQLRMAEKVGYDINLYGNFWSQYVNQCKSTNQYYTVMTYDVTNSTFTSVWSYEYASILPGIKEIMQNTGDDANKNYNFVADICLTYNLYLLTSLYGDVAYSEGYLTESTTPNFDSEKAMQNILLEKLEKITSMNIDDIKAAEEANSMAAKKSDMIFYGDMDGWMQFANTLYLKIMMRDFETNRSKIEQLLAKDNFLKSDCKFDNFEDKADKSNPLYESDRRQLNTTENIRSCADILGVLDSSDPRLPYYYENYEVYGLGNAYGVTSDIDKSARLYIGVVDPVYFGTADEAEFLKAECYARLGGDANIAKAKACYNEALKLAFARIADLTKDNSVTLSDDLATKYAFSGTTTEEMVECIINQKWASNVRCMPIESWFDLNRTGYPQRGKTITDSHGVLESGYPQRFIISKTSVDNNPNHPEIKDVNEKMWWQK